MGSTDLIPDLKKIDSFEIRQKLEDLDFDVIKGELEFLAESDILTNLVNLMEQHWDQVYETSNDILGLENEVKNEVETVERKRRSSGSYLEDIIFIVLILYVLSFLFGSSSTVSSAAVALNSNIGMGLIVLFVARKLLKNYILSENFEKRGDFSCLI